MEKESFYNGYCRMLDGSRTVAVVTENGELLEVDCCYETCIHTPNCTIAQNITQQLSADPA